jgi:exodeoxyribonuclease V alpha subunit
VDKLTLTDEQEHAVRVMTTERIGCVTGGPGTGKTTCLGHAQSALEHANRAYVLCAPTGKAARRMAEQSGVAAYTIHRLLGWQGDGKFTYNANNPLPYDTIICDEASMIDIRLLGALFSAIDLDTTSVMFMGDVDQLPPVGAGCPFRDLIWTYEGTDQLPIVRLTIPQRQAEGSWVANNAPHILTGGYDLDLEDQEDFIWAEVRNPVNIGPTVLELFDEINDPDNIQVLTPTKIQHAPGSTVELNKLLQDKLNPGTGGWNVYKQMLREGSRVMQMKNNYNIHRFNGEVGKIVGLNEQSMVVDYADQYTAIDTTSTTKYTQADAQELQLAYAATIHKSQGSEFDHVIVIMHSKQPRQLLSRQLLYTAITRAKKAVYLVGDQKGLDLACSNNKAISRKTLLVDKMETLRVNG